ncbi:MAG: hypothetical protein PWP60_59 [Candidatus Atribacteria bacterium]|jgi:mannose-6-phosphate isomerase-like protein (cupin superfamily)|uniref:Dimethylsulfonioproprionate lyase family protein n=1 Tax=Thermatribacter velox TaxID=3039681 RepID=A0ABZ2YE61_9BACT|nr:hypothetical protein [Candidatus Atribacteria bacterium]
MAYKVNINNVEPDTCDRSFRYFAKDKKGETLRDTYWLIDPENSPSQRLKLGYTIVYPDGKTTGHAHPDQEEVYFILSGRGEMEIEEERFPIQEGDAFYVEPGKFHVTYNTGILPLVILWVTGKVD